MKILVPLSGDPHSETILPYLEGLAQVWKASLILLRVVDPMAAAGDPLAAALKGTECETLASAQDYLQNLAQGFTNIPVVTVCGRGPAREVICQEAAGLACDLIAFAPHGHSGLGRWVFGSVAEEVVHHSPCPVLLVRGEAHLRFQHVLLPTDGSKASAQVWDEFGRFAPGNPRATLLYCQGQQSLDEDLRERLDSCLKQHPGWQLQILAKEPLPGILEWALDSDCDLVVMASHGRSGLQHLWAGSVTEQVARQAPCPVLVFPKSFLDLRAAAG